MSFFVFFFDPMCCEGLSARFVELALVRFGLIPDVCEGVGATDDTVFFGFDFVVVGVVAVEVLIRFRSGEGVLLAATCLPIGSKFAPPDACLFGVFVTGSCVARRKTRRWALISSTLCWAMT